MIFGIDVSKWQGTIDWPKVAAAGVRYAFIKATEGVGYVDPMLHRNARGADAVGLKVGLYHFLRVDNPNPKAEAEHFVETIKGLPYEWIVCDIEDAKGKSAQEIIDYTYLWLKRVEVLTGKRPIVYTYTHFVYEYLHYHLVDWPLWIAHYGVDRPGDTAWPEWICWQSTDVGTVDGIAGNVDYNWMRPEFFEYKTEKKGNDRKLNWTTEQWGQFAKYLQAACNRGWIPYSEVEKAYNGTLTVEEALLLQATITSKLAWFE